MDWRIWSLWIEGWGFYLYLKAHRGVCVDGNIFAPTRRVAGCRPLSPLSSVVERLSCKQKVRGAIPRGGTKLLLRIV
jgi:hypothetical protein